MAVTLVLLGCLLLGLTAGAPPAAAEDVPVITQDPHDTTAPYPSSSVVLTFTATGHTSFQWQRSSDEGGTWADITSPGNPCTTCLELTPSPSLHDDLFRVVVTNGAGSATSQIARLSISWPPIITSQPANQVALNGTTATFTVGVDGHPTPTVQWQRNSAAAPATYTDIAGATSPSYSVTATSALNGRGFRAVLTNANGVRTSTAATLTLATAPSITTSPASVTVAANRNHTFTSGASGTPTPTRQWERSLDGGTTWEPIPGATGGSYTLVAVPLALDGSRYRVVATNEVGSATSGVAVLTVVQAPHLVASPSNQTVAAGQTVSLFSSAIGDPTPTPAWERSDDGGATWATVPGATATTYAFTAAQTDHGARFRAVHSNLHGSVTSGVALVQVDVVPRVTLQPVSTTVPAGTTVTFTAAATSSLAITTQWEAKAPGSTSFSAVAGATAGSLDLAASAATTGTQVRARFTTASGSVTTATATLTATAPPSVTADPHDATAAPGTVVTLTSAGTGLPTPSARWQRSVDGGSTWTDLLGAVGTSYAFIASSTYDGAWYRVVYSNASGTAASAPAVLTIVLPPTVTAQPASVVTPAEGGTATFAVATSGWPTPTLQWQRLAPGGSTFVDVPGATSPTYTVDVSAADHGTRVRVVATNVHGTATSTIAGLSVGGAPVLLTEPADVHLTWPYPGTSLRFTASAAGAPTLAYQWQRSTDGGATWADVAGMTSSLLTVGPAEGSYRVVVTNGVGSVASRAAEVRLDAPAAIATQPTSQSASVGTDALLEVVVSGRPAPAIEWRRRTCTLVCTWAPVAGGTSPALTVPVTAPGTVGTFRAVVSNSYATVTSDEVTVTGHAAPVVTTQPVDLTVTYGGTATFSVATSGHPAPTFQWQTSRSGTTWTDVAGATGPVLDLGVAPMTASGNRYRVVATNALGSTTSGIARLTVAKAPQAITFPDLPTDPPVGTVTVLAATSTSGATVTYTATGGCTVASGRVTYRSTTPCTVTATRAATSTHLAADPVVRSTVPVPGPQVITFAALPLTLLVGDEVVLSPRASSGLGVTLVAEGACSVDGTRLRVDAPGTCVVTATQPGDASWLAAPAVVRTRIVKAPQSITFPDLPVAPAPGSTTTLAATASSGLSVTYVAAGACTVSGRTLRFTTSGGMCTVTARRAATNTYLAAPDVVRETTVG